jgi:hypothetical protein
MTIIPLKTADNPAKAKLLALVDEVRAEIEADQCLALVIVPLFGELKFHVRSAGDISMARLAGILGRAWMDATEALKDRA